MAVQEDFGALIAVEDDASFDARHRPAPEAEGASAWWQTAGNLALTYARMNFYVAGAEAVVEVYKRLTRDKGTALDLKPVSMSSAKALLRFPPGHPRTRVIYAKHPAEQDLFYPAALFHRKVFEHKVGEACRLLAALGARELRIEHKSGWSKEFAASLAVPVPSAGESVGASAGSTSNSSDRILLQASLAGHDSPGLPEGMVWFEHEPAWQSIAEMRMKSGMKEFSLVVAYEEDYQVNASLKASVANSNLELGGNFVDHVATVWTISGTFGSVA